MKRYNKKVLAHYEKELDGEEFAAIVLMDDSNEYYNIHVISERFQSDEINTLKLQEPINCVTLESFTAAKLAGYIMEHFIWDRFYDEFGAASITVEIEEDGQNAERNS